MTVKRYKSVVMSVVLVFVLSSLACSIGGRSGGRTPQMSTRERQVSTPRVRQGTPTPAPQAETATPTPAPSPTNALAITPKPDKPLAEIPPDQGPLDVAQIPELEVTTLDPRGEALIHLSTFRQRMTAEFAAPDNAANGVYRYEAEVNTTDQAAHVTVIAEGSSVQQLPANQVEAIWIGTKLWIKVGSLPWMPVPEDVAEMQFDEQTISVGTFLPYASHFDRVQPDETVNGIPCAHYTYDAQDLPTEYGTVDAHGHVWVALDGGYVVRYTMEATGGFEDHFQGIGTLKLVYDTYDVGADIQIDPPRR